MGFNKGIYGITGCSIMLQMAEKNSFKHGLVLTHEKEKGVLFGLRVIMICSYQLCFSLKSANDLN